MISREAVLLLAQQVIDYKAISYVEAARVLSLFLLRDEQDRVQVYDTLGAAQARGSELLEQRRTLARLIEQIAAADPDARDALVAEALSAARACQ
jgi:DNA-directed RNA polymerase subunit F